MDVLVMTSILKKISSFFYIPAKEFNIVRFRYKSNETEIKYTLKGSVFGIPIYMDTTDKILSVAI